MKKKKRKKCKRGFESTDVYATEYVFATKYVKRELRHGEMARTDRKAGASRLRAVNGANDLRQSQHEQGEEKELFTSRAGSVMTDQFGPRRAAKKRKASRQADGKREEERVFMPSTYVSPLTAYCTQSIWRHLLDTSQKR